MIIEEIENARRIIFDKVILPDMAYKVCLAAGELGIHVSSYYHHEWYVEKMDSWAERETGIVGRTPNLKYFKDLLGQKSSLGVNKFLLIGEPNHIERVQKELLQHLVQDLIFFVQVLFTLKL